jgi:hypothetical protein
MTTTDDADAVHGAHCCFGPPTAPSIGALLRSVGAAQPVAQPGRERGTKEERSICSDQSDPFAAPAAAVGVTTADGETAPPPAPSGVPSLCETQRKSSSPQAPSVAAPPQAEPAHLALVA